MTESQVPSDTVLLDYGLRAQARMFPYTLGFFGVGLPLFIWAASTSVSPWLMAAYIVLLSGIWPAFMVLRNRSEALAAAPRTEANVKARLLRQGVGGGLWALCLTAISLTSGGTGPGADVLMMICAGAAISIIFFCTPVLLHLLIVGPAALLGPLLVLYSTRSDSHSAELMTGGLILAFAMALVLNRHMREHYMLQVSALDTARAREDATAARMALMETLSREVKTGLQGIEHHLTQSAVSLVRAPAPRRLVETALEEVGRLQTILVTTLDNDEAETGQIAVERLPLDIELICERVMAGFASLAHGKDLGFTLSASEMPTSGSALGDTYRVEQILEHLVSNALQYTQHGRVEVRLTRPDDAQVVRIEVVDSGPGLSPEEVEQAFAPYQRIARTSAGCPGAGLGLSLSRSLAALMGGDMGAQSTLGVGSKFWLDLPYDASASPPARPAAPEAETPESDSFLRVLLLANDSLRAAQLRDQLEEMGHRCLTSTSRERALALAKKGGLDACVISTGSFENLQEATNRQTLDTFLSSLRATQEEARLKIVALLPNGDQAEDLQSLGVKPLLLPHNREGLYRALVSD
jgi:two-component system, sensor histidine kinase